MSSPDTPPLLKSLVVEATLEERKRGRLGSHIYRYRRRDGTGLYLKIGEGYAAIDLDAERERLQWLENKLPVPKVFAYESCSDSFSLLVSEVPGVGSQTTANPERAVEILAQGLRSIHTLDTRDCPFVNTLREELDESERRIREHTLNVPAFVEATGRTPEDVLSELKANTGLLRDFAFTHGDYCMPNVLLKGEQLSGFIDWGIAGVADIHRDFMAMAESIAMNCGTEWVPAFYQAYGYKPDPERVRFYTLLDAFFAHHEP